MYSFFQPGQGPPQGRVLKRPSIAHEGWERAGQGVRVVPLPAVFPSAGARQRRRLLLLLNQRALLPFASRQSDVSSKARGWVVMSGVSPRPPPAVILHSQQARVAAST